MSVHKGRIPQTDNQTGRRLPDVKLSRQLAAAYVAGATLRELYKLHKHTGLSYGGVRQLVVDGGATLRAAPNRWRFETPPTLAEEYNAGASMAELAARYGATAATIRHRLQTVFGVTLRVYQPTCKPVDGEFAEQLADEYTRGASLEELCERHALSYRAVRGYVIASGTALRPARARGGFTAPESLAAEYAAGASMGALARKYGVSYGVIRRRLPTPDSGRRPAHVQLRGRLAAEYAKGSSLKELRDRHGLPYSTVRDHLIASGTTLRPPVRVPKFKPPTTLAEEYAAGATIRELAKKYEVSYGTMRRRLIAHPDVPLRPTGVTARSS